MTTGAADAIETIRSEGASDDVQKNHVEFGKGRDELVSLFTVRCAGHVESFQPLKCLGRNQLLSLGVGGRFA